MTYEWQIQEGDTVTAHFVDSKMEPVTGTVKHRPQDTGDSWIIETELKQIVYIQLFAKMVRVSQPFRGPF